MQNIDDRLDIEVRALTKSVVELSIYIEEHFKNAVAQLFTRDWVSGYFPITPDISPITLNGQAFQLLSLWAPSGEQFRTIMIMQKACKDLESLLALVNSMGEHARMLDRDVEYELAALPSEERQGLYRIINLAYMQLRGCTIALNTCQSSFAQRVIEQDGELDLACLRMQTALQGLLELDVTRAVPINYIKLIISNIERMGNFVTHICQGIQTIPAYQGEVGASAWAH